MEKVDEKFVTSRAQRIKYLLETYLPMDPEIAGPYMEEVRKIHEELESMELPVVVERKIKINQATLEVVVDVDVTVLKPKENMSPEDAKIYDEWLLKRNSWKPSGAPA